MCGNDGIVTMERGGIGRRLAPRRSFIAISSFFVRCYQGQPAAMRCGGEGTMCVSSAGGGVPTREEVAVHCRRRHGCSSPSLLQESSSLPELGPLANRNTLPNVLDPATGSAQERAHGCAGRRASEAWQLVRTANVAARVTLRRVPRSTPQSCSTAARHGRRDRMPSASHSASALAQCAAAAAARSCMPRAPQVPAQHEQARAALRDVPGCER